LPRRALRIALIVFTTITLLVHLYLGVSSLFFTRFGPPPGAAGPQGNSVGTQPANPSDLTPVPQGTPALGGGNRGQRGQRPFGGFDFLGVLWLLNAVSYGALLAVNFTNVPYFKDHRKLAITLLAGFAVVTIMAWIGLSGVLRSGGLARQNSLAYPDKVDEVLLVIAAIWYARGA
jgi:hypothetical protein